MTAGHRQDDAFVLDSTALGESDSILTLLVDGVGLVRGVAKAARRSRKRFGGSLEPLSRVRVEWRQREGRDLQRFNSLDLLESHAAMQSDPALQAVCAVISEITRETSREDGGDPRISRLIGATLAALAEGLEPFVAVRYFEFWTLRLHGLISDLSACVSCQAELGKSAAFPSAAGDGLVCRNCAAGEELDHNLAPGGPLRTFLTDAAILPPLRMGGRRGVADPGGVLERLLRGALESYTERRFRTYRHLRALSSQGPGS